ncbi:MAG: NAD(P)H-dependent oxidoreductase [Pseudomonadota bacterium]
MARNILHIDASARSDGSYSRALTAQLVEKLKEAGGDIVHRDVGLNPLPVVTQDWVGANFTPDEARTEAQRETLALSDVLIEELKAADVLVIGAPVYNFGVPASLKAWIDLIARARKTFKYTDQGPVGLLEDKTAYIVIATGGTPSGSDMDFATPYLRHILSFLGIRDVTIIAADQLMATGDEKIAAAQREIDALAA